MTRTHVNIRLEDVPTPCYLVDEVALEDNLKILDSVQKTAECRILLALKGFAMWHFAPLIRRYLAGASASSLDEARLAFEEFGREVHVCGAGYSDAHFQEITRYADHIVFNSFSQYRRLRAFLKNAPRPIECGIRINPEYSEVATPIYDPCYPCSRLGVTLDRFEPEGLEGICGLHFHCLCEQDAGVLERVLGAAEKKFGRFFKGLKWVNFGGGHHITKAEYDVEALCRMIVNFKARYGVDVYLEPGEAVALNTGILVSSVLDVVENRMRIAILDASAATHMPDVLEMPYRPEIIGGGEPQTRAHTFRLAGPSCLAGDVIGDYSFDRPLEAGNKLIFLDMAHYTMVKNNTFNGIRLPSIGVFNSRTGEVRIIRTFGYEDYRNRLS
ncbi:MAG: carboxynorspermidine decarboxylase [Desulfobacterales bacterium]|nr:carboxynorspermidine decarboxylase [Desulfobacterales bacterium]